jgi:hypothetical protein
VTIPLDEYRLEEITHDHQIGAAVFVPFAIARLSGNTGVTDATLTVRLRNVGGVGEALRSLRLVWSETSSLAQPLAVCKSAP